MSHPFRASEIVEVALKPDLDLTSIETAKHQKAILDTIASQPGCVSIYYGPSVEHKDKMVMVIEWAKMDDHTAFTQTPEYKTFGEYLATHMMTAITAMSHVREPFQAEAPAALSAPITELLSVDLAGDVDSAAFDERVAAFTATLKEQAAGLLALAGGWVVEERDVDGQKGRGYEVAIGWESLEAHMAFRETQAFRDSVPPLIAFAKGRRVHHVKFTKYEK